jgi:hypothetical protein
MINSMKIWILLILGFCYFDSIYCQQVNDMQKELPDSQNFLAFNLGASYEYGNILMRIDASYNKSIHENGFLGCRIGYETNGAYFNKIQIGPCYNYSFLKKSFTPFTSIDLRAENTTHKSYNGSINKFNFNYFGATGLIGLGCKYRLNNKKIGFECKYNVGSTLYRPITNSFLLDNYKFKVVNYFQVGFIYFI